MPPHGNRNQHLCTDSKLRTCCQQPLAVTIARPVLDSISTEARYPPNSSLISNTVALWPGALILQPRPQRSQPFKRLQQVRSLRGTHLAPFYILHSEAQEPGTWHAGVCRTSSGLFHGGPRSGVAFGAQIRLRSTRSSRCYRWRHVAILASHL